MPTLTRQEFLALQNSREELILNLDKLTALIDLVTAARLSEVTEKTLFNYFRVISESLQQIKLAVNYDN